MVLLIGWLKERAFMRRKTRIAGDQLQLVLLALGVANTAFKDEAWPGHRNGGETVVWGLDGLDNPYVVLEERGVIFDARFWMVCVGDVSF